MTSTRTRLALLGAVAGTALAAVPPAAAQTLTEALAHAYATNPTLLTARAQLRATDENVPQALAGWRPQVTVGGNYGFQDNHLRFYSAPSATQALLGVPGSRSYYHADRPTNSVTGTVTQPIFRGGRTVASTRRAENQVFGQRARLLATEQQVLQQGTNAYVQVILNQELVRLNTNNVQVLTEQLRATNERFRVGEITRTDVAQAEAALAGGQANRAQSEGNLQTARATFQQVIGLAPQRLTAPQPLRQPTQSSVEAGQVAGANNPNVVAALFDEAAARDNIDIQVATLMPQLNLQAQAYRQDSNSTTYSQTQGATAIMSLTLPLYQGGAEYAAVRQARQQAVQARSVVDDQRRQAVQAAVQAFEQLVAARAQVEATRSQIRASEVALDGVQREAIVGSRTTYDVLVAEQNLLQARTSLVQNLATLVQASYALATAVGRLTAEDLALPVTLYDSRAYYTAVRDRWFGLGDYSQEAAR